MLWYGTWYNADLSSSSPGKKPISLVGTTERIMITFSYFVFGSNTCSSARYKEIKVFRPKDLSQSIQERIKKFQNKGKNRYYGFEIWKEDIVRTYLNQIPKNSILQYTDVGCHLNRKGIEKLKEYINITDENNILVFQYGKTPIEIKNKYN